MERYKAAQSKLFDILAQKEIFWKQRSKELWLQAGDQNTKYFHACATSKKKNNQISRLKNKDGDWVDWGSGLKEVMKDYYKDLFTASNTNYTRVTDCITQKISASQNAMLLDHVDSSEVRKAVFQMHPDKSPGPDGFNPGFYQKFWDIVGTDVVRLVQNFFTAGEFPDHLSDTYICLIQKKTKPETMGDLRPIALCNVVYKILSKVLANRLKTVLPQVVSDTQSAFLPGRLITDNILISFEIMHYLKRKQQGKEGYMAIKLDMSKAYDRVEWDFLQAMLHKLGFSEQLIDMIMKCVSSVSYKILSGQQEIGPIVPGRGLRQGDPLSSYLFILCTEGLSALIKENERTGRIQGCKIARRAPVISHMLFADDTYLYCKAREEDTRNVVDLLRCFQVASGQQVNLNKSSVFFSSNTEVGMRLRVCSVLGVNEAGESSTYLGLPNILGRNKSVLLGYLKEKMRQRIQRWEGSFISKAGEELLIKIVAQSLPCYAMNVFLLPVELCREMEQLMCKYWWQSSSKNSKGIHWKRWDKLTTHKSKGGMGFRNLRDFNLCLLSKQGWRLQCHPESLVGRIFKARYYASGDYLNAELGSNPSFVWRSMFEAQQIVKLGARKRIGNGDETSILKDPWLPCATNPRVTTVRPSLVNNKVSLLMETDNLTWDVDLVRDLFNERDAEIILSITLNSSRSLDNWYWSFEKSGYFSVKSAYRHLQQSKEDGAGLVSSALWQNLWKMRVPPKVKDLLWRAASNCLPTKTQLRSRRVNVDAICPMCQSHRETISQCMVECSFARSCWYQFDAGICTDVTGTFANWLEGKLKDSDGGKRQRLAMICWALWKARNELVWNNKGPKIDVVMALVYTSLENWK